MLKKLGSDLLYFILKSVDRYDDPSIGGYVVHPDYLSVVMESVEESTEEELEEIKHVIRIELSEGGYLDNQDFLKNLDSYFSKARGVSNPLSWNLYKIILSLFNELKHEDGFV